MNKKIEEMIALGASYALNCQPCMEFHRKAAIEAGLTAEEMQAAYTGRGCGQDRCGEKVETICRRHVRRCAGGTMLRCGK